MSVYISTEQYNPCVSENHLTESDQRISQLQLPMISRPHNFYFNNFVPEFDEIMAAVMMLKVRNSNFRNNPSTDIS